MCKFLSSLEFMQKREELKGHKDEILSFYSVLKNSCKGRISTSCFSPWLHLSIFTIGFMHQ